MRKIGVILIVIFAFLKLNTLEVSANEFRLINEINNVSINKSTKSIEVNGWGFIHNAQNYRNSSTHSYELELKSKTDSIKITGLQTPISHTETMFLIGSPYCRDNQLGLSARICNNYYNNIGFKFSIPLSKFKMNQTYTAKLTVFAKSSNTSKTVPVYFPNKNTITLKDDHKEYVLDSKLHNMKVKVLNSSVFARSNTNKNNRITSKSLNCKNRYLQFKQNSTYNNIFNKQVSNNTTYYELSGAEDICFNGWPLIKEGSTVKPVWIASTFIEHLGEALTIKTKEVNNPPTITIKNHPTIYVGETVNLMEGVSAYDIEDGDLTHKVKIVENTYKDYPGSYNIKYEVIDSFNAKTHAYKRVTVLRRNYPPVIVASDISIMQYANFNPLAHVSAYDQDNTDITNRIELLNNIDTSIIKVQKQCYKVRDRYNLEASKCINVTIEKNPSNFRFIQKSNVFYKESIPLVWQEKMNTLYSEIDNKVIYDSLIIEK